VILLFLFSSCKVINPNEIFYLPSTYTYSNFENTDYEEHRIEPFDKLDIRIFYNNGIQLIEYQQTNLRQETIEYDVEHDGMVKLPVVGRIKLAGLTIREAEDTLQKLFSKYLVDPFVKIKIPNKKVIVFTSGSSNGKIIYFKNENLTLVEAIAEAGGIPDNSKSYKIKLIRGPLNNPKIYIFNLYNTKDYYKYNFNLKPNDIIYIEKRIMPVSKILTEISPYLSLISTSLIVFSLFTK